MTDSKSLLVLGHNDETWEDKKPYPPRQYPATGSGRIEAVYATAANGPHLPCAVDDAGQQVPCGVPPAQHPGQPLLIFEPEQDLFIHISRLKVNAVKAVSSAQFTVVVEVTLTWTSPAPTASTCLPPVRRLPLRHAGLDRLLLPRGQV